MRREYQIGNRFIKATVTKPSASMRTLAPVRSLVHVPMKYEVNAGEILLEGGKPYLLLAEHHTIQRVQIFLGLLINAEVSLVRTIPKINPVTKMAAGSETLPEKKVSAVHDLLMDDREAKMTFDKSVFFFGEEVTTEDKVNNQRVRAVAKLNGIYRAEVY